MEEKIKEFYKMFPNVESPENYPKQFEYYIKLFKYFTQNKEVVKSES
jgi:hypothetical protein